MASAAAGQINTEELPSWGSRNVDCFEKLEQIGEGTYGQVFMARETRTGEIVALKKIRMDNEKEGFPITAIREIKILKKLHHENIVKLKEIVTSNGPEGDEQGNQDGNKSEDGIYMVFEYMDHDLTGLADRPGLRFTVPQIKLLTGLHYCHVNQVLHRDIKGSNLLIDNEGKLKLADFGLARSFCSNHEGNLTNRVITLWYRPPELLLGATKYGPAVDIWSVGCIFAELLHGKPILQGRSEVGHPLQFFSTLIIGFRIDEFTKFWLVLQMKSQPDQLNKIFELCGSLDEINWPDVSKSPWNNNFKPTRTMKRRVREIFRHFDSHALDLLDHLLALDPNQRWTAKQALDAEYFLADPLPCDPKSLPKYESSHEFQTKKKKQQRRQTEEITKGSKSQHYDKHYRLPPIQHTGQAPPRWYGPNHPINDAQPPLSAGPSHHHYGKPHGPPGGPSRHPPGNQGGSYHQNCIGQVGGYSGGPYPPQGRAPPYAGSGMTAPSSRGAPGGYGVGPPNYSQTNQYGIPAAGRGVNIRNQRYGRQ